MNHYEGTEIPYSKSTIARIIKSLKKRGAIIDPKVKVSLYGRTGRIVIRTRKKKKKLRRKGFYPRKPGDILFPFKIERIQTGKGSEFEGEFDKFLRKKGIIHFYTYPRDPQSNGHIERSLWNTYYGTIKRNPTYL